MLQILTIHEAYPGHYVQLEYSNRYPSLVRKVLWSGTFAEGWAVYTEQMMLDQGYGDGDLSLRLHQLKFYHAGGAQRDPRPQDALREHDRRGGDEAAGGPRLPDGGGGGGQDRAGEAERARSSRRTSSAARRSTACGRTCSASRATSSTWASSTRRCSATARCR